MARIVIAGGHGKIALLASPLLIARGHQVTALIRNPEHAADITAVGATPLVADLESHAAADIAGVLSGHDVVVWSAGAGGGSPDRTYAVDRDAAIRTADATAQAGIDRFIMVSYFGARIDHGVPADSSFFAYAEAKAAADEYLQNTKLQWTILAPSSLTQDPPTGRIDTTATKSGSVSRADVAAVVAETVDQPATIGQFITFNIGATPIAEALA